MPVMSVKAIGYGRGTKEFETANCLRAMLGEAEDLTDDIVELSCNVDDMTGEDIGYATDILLKEGASDVYTTSVGMKKGRPGTVITVMCHPHEKKKFVGLMFKHTTTIGVRESSFARYVLDRKSENVDTQYGKVSIKRSEGYGVTKIKAEYEDLYNVAKSRDISIDEARSLVRKETDDRS
jgi:uncharacterized protein (DUF111 family)